MCSDRHEARADKNVGTIVLAIKYDLGACRNLSSPVRHSNSLAELIHVQNCKPSLAAITHSIPSVYPSVDERPVPNGVDRYRGCGICAHCRKLAQWEWLCGHGDPGNGTHV